MVEIENNGNIYNDHENECLKHHISWSHRARKDNLLCSFCFGGGEGGGDKGWELFQKHYTQCRHILHPT